MLVERLCREPILRPYHSSARTIPYPLNSILSNACSLFKTNCSPSFPKLHRMTELTIRNGAIDEILGKRKVAVVGTIPDNAVPTAVVGHKNLLEIFPSLIGKRRGGIERAILEQNSKPS